MKRIEKTAHDPPAPPPVIFALNAPDAARSLSLSVRSFRRLVAAGTLPPGIRLGGRRAWSVASLERVVATLEAAGAAGATVKRGKT